MIVRQDDPGAAVLQRVGDDFPKGKDGAGLVPFMAGDVQAASKIIDMRDPQAFAPRVEFGKAACEKAARGSESIELKWTFGALIMHVSLTM